MKYGIEVEGRLKGVSTVFISAEELLVKGVLHVKAAMLERGTRHLYISDRENVLYYGTVGSMFADFLVTLDVTQVRKDERPSNVTLMVTLPYEVWDAVSNLRPDDQIKFHSPQRDVLCASARHFVRTDPKDFAGDIEL